VQFAVKAVTDPQNPTNSGCYRSVKVMAPLGTIFNPRLPAPVVGCNSEVGIILADAVFGALSKACPDRVAAGSSGSGAIVFVGGTRPDGTSFSFMEALGSAGGARSDADGWDGYRVGTGNMGVTSFEILETECPIRTLAYGLADGWSGAGRHRGGLPARHVFELLGPATLTITAERSLVGPFGLFGGEPGHPAEYILNPGTPQERLLFSKTEPMRLPAGTVVSITPAGGGGFGPPAERDPVNHLRDLKEGHI
jgi:N-methylhydantoinase B